MIEFETEDTLQVVPSASIQVIGVGGAGGNAVESIITSGYPVKCLVANTDAQALMRSSLPTHQKIQLGVKSTKGLGAGANPEVGKRSAEEDLQRVLETVGTADIVFLVAGMGGGTGSGGLPVLARALKEQGILTIAVVTKPFVFEGKKRAQTAQEAISLLQKEVDALIVVPNQKLLEAVGHDVSMIEAFERINEVLCQSVKGISDIITKPGHINVDFADLRAIMRDKGLAIMGTGQARGADRAEEAALNAITSPLLENMSIQGAQAVLMNITGGKNLSLHEISKAASIIYEQVDQHANIILGSVIDESMNEDIAITIIATGFTHKTPDAPKVAHEQVMVEVQAAQPTPQKIVHTQPTETAVDSSSLQSAVKAVDTNDLDVPAFLRKEIKVEQHVE